MTATRETLCTLAGYFADVLWEWSTPEEWAKMQADNLAEANPLVCHSHDFCDANMAMAAAFKRMFGREMTLPSDVEEGRATSEQEDSDLAIWNGAWEIATKGWLTEGCENEPTRQ